jgi:hypothetical protein
MKDDYEILNEINKKKKPINILYIVIIIIFWFFGFFAARCSANEILITDFQFTNQNYSLNKIHRFIKKFPNNKFTDKQVYFINWQCRAWTINPLPVLATMEKETSIISVPDNVNSYKWREHRAMGYGLINSTRSNGKKYYKYGFFDIQIHQGVRILRKLFDEYIINYKLKIDDGKKVVTLKNASTYALYRYTPYTKGNEDFKKIYLKFKNIWNSID